ncbi:DNA repair exonuclease [Ornithinibacillus sp. L9]|uniref:DNA repair exonuclease n=1 Tax=Ornithinibacillus caprae TaxID=2678566 RepID=A0A6N8FK96_9BACI|nr:DNA repair exonuclease [Ornithinibacillus caprae]
MSTEVSFIHAADLHLDSPFKGLAHVPDQLFKEIRESTFKALENLVSTAIVKQVDFVILVGDLFDNERQSLKAQVKLKKAFEELGRHHINVYLSYGNHDFIKGNIHPITYPSNVFVFSREEVDHFTYIKGGQPLANIYGFSYENRAVKQKKVSEYKIKDPNVPYHIAMLHGSIASNTEHDLYAPFQLGDLMQEHFSYWALGHIHKREVLKFKPPVVYPGNIQGRSRKESAEKGCYHVRLTETNMQTDFIPLQAIQFNSISVDLSHCKEIHEAEAYIRSEIAENDQLDVPQLLDLTIQGNTEKLKQWKNEQLLEDVIEIINESFIETKIWSYVYRYQISISEQDAFRSYEGEHFIGELTRQLKNASIATYISELYQHKDARKYMEKLSTEDIEEIKREAYDLLIHELLEK